MRDDAIARKLGERVMFCGLDDCDHFKIRDRKSAAQESRSLVRELRERVRVRGRNTRTPQSSYMNTASSSSSSLVTRR